MSEIKFRAWDKRHHKYLDPELLLITAQGNLMELVSTYDIESLKDEFYEVEQYTGMKDTNGHEIYEGDITLCKELMTLEQVVFIDGQWRLSVSGNALSEYKFADLEVEGNIHENPELLEGE